jgi:hypothetical protein
VEQVSAFAISPPAGVAAFIVVPAETGFHQFGERPNLLA